MGRPKGSKDGQHMHRHGSIRCYSKCACRCDACVEGHERHLEWFREYQKQRPRHGLTASERSALMARGCWVCGSFDDLVIDHDHRHCAGRFGCEECVRGILCGDCNRALGMARDDPAILIGLAQYLVETNLVTQIQNAEPGKVIDIWRSA